jgi:hypothetical protein
MPTATGPTLCGGEAQTHTPSHPPYDPPDVCGGTVWLPAFSDVAPAAAPTAHRGTQIGALPCGSVERVLNTGARSRVGLRRLAGLREAHATCVKGHRVSEDDVPLWGSRAGTPRGPLASRLSATYGFKDIRFGHRPALRLSHCGMYTHIGLPRSVTTHVSPLARLLARLPIRTPRPSRRHYFSARHRSMWTESRGAAQRARHLTAPSTHHWHHRRASPEHCQKCALAGRAGAASPLPSTCRRRKLHTTWRVAPSA